jgi:hypothetical protein
MQDPSSLVIRGGTIVDGSGGDPYEADLAVANSRIAAIGRSLPSGGEEIDARGKLVTPGFVDVHTHYDAQVTWSSQLTPSSWNGVTTVLIGNCGVGFAPCEPARRDMLVRLMEGVEDIPEVVLTEGLPWNWRSFPDYLDALRRRRRDTGAARRFACPCHGPAWRRPRTCDGAGSRCDGAARRRGHPGGRTRILDLAHAQSPHHRRPADTHAERGGD